MTRTVLFLSHTAELNGAERWLLETLGRLDAGRFRPVLAAPGPGPLTRAAETAGIESAAVPMKWWLTSAGRAWRQPAAWAWNVRGVRRLAALIREKKIGLVFTNTAATLTGAWAARAAGVPHVWMIHELLGGARPQLVCLLGRRWLLDFIVRSSAAVLVNSEAARRPFSDLDRISIVYNAIPEWSGRRPARTRRAVRDGWGFAAADFVCGIVGKVCEAKGQREVVLAVAALRERYPRLKLLVIGAEPESGYARDLRRLVRTRELGDAVVFAGFQEDIHSAYAGLDLVVVGSARESFGRPALEAQSLGVPVVAVAGGGIGEIVEHGRTGWIADSGRPEAIAAGIAHVLDHPGEAREAARRGRRAAGKRFAPDVQTRRIEAALEAALG